MAKWEFERTGMITRAVIADSTVDAYKDLIITDENPKGIIQAANIKGMRDPWNRLELIAQGYWPRPAPRKEGGFNLIMDPPKIENGRIIVEGRKVGQYAVEGLTTISKLLLQDHADHSDTRPMWGTNKDGAATFESESLVQTDPSKPPTIQKLKIGRAVGGHFGSVQGWVLNVMIPRFSELRYVDRVIWTAHTGRGVDDFSGLQGKALGPATVGQASVDKTSQLFGHTFHFEVSTNFGPDGKVKRTFKAWFISHPSEELKTLNWPAKVSLSVEKAKELLKLYPCGYIDLTNEGMGQWLSFLHPTAEAKPK
jgi:hypothetical protein